MKIQPADTQDAVTDVTPKPLPAAASLNDLEREATLLDTSPELEAQAGRVAELEEVTFSNEQELYGALEMARAMAFPLLAQVTPADRMAQLDAVWNTGVLKATAAAGAAVMAKHGWTMGGVMGEYGCYLMLALALGPPVIATKKILGQPLPKPEKDAPAAPVGG